MQLQHRLAQQSPAGVCRPDPACRRFPPSPRGYSCSGTVWSTHSPASPLGPVQSPTRKATSCCSYEDFSCTSPWAGRGPWSPATMSGQKGDVLDSAPQSRPPRVGSSTISQVLASRTVDMLRHCLQHHETQRGSGWHLFHCWSHSATYEVICTIKPLSEEPLKMYIYLGEKIDYKAHIILVKNGLNMEQTQKCKQTTAPHAK